MTTRCLRTGLGVLALACTPLLCAACATDRGHERVAADAATEVAAAPAAPRGPDGAAGQAAAATGAPAAAGELAGVLTVRVTEKGFEDAASDAAGPTGSVALMIELENVGARDLAAVSGVLRLEPRAGGWARELEIAYDQPLEVGRKVYWLHRVPFDPADEGDRRLRDAPLADLSATWLAREVRFADGETLGFDG